MPRQFIDRSAQPCVIPLDQAWYCESCRAICNRATCCSCASAQHTQRLAMWLDREFDPIRIPLTGVFLSVIPHLKHHAAKENHTALRRVPRAS